MYGYIYKTTNLDNGKFYIGQKKSKKIAYAEGRHNVNFTEEVRKKMSEKAKNRSHPPTTLGRKCVTNGINNKVVEVEDVDYWLSQGWHLGRTINNIPWNKGLSKNTDERLMKLSNDRRKIFEAGNSVGCYGVKGNKFRYGVKMKDSK